MRVLHRSALWGAILLLGSLGAAQAQISLGKPVTGSGFYNSGTETFPFQNITNGRYNDTGSPGDWSFWLTDNGLNGFATIDLQGDFVINRIDVQNTHNR